MSAETLRKAAALMRERAEAATPGPWSFTHGMDARYMVLAAEETFRVRGEGYGDGEHIAGMDPLVAIAVADWLDDQARYWDTVDADPSYGYMEGDPALNVARAYLRPRP